MRESGETVPSKGEDDVTSPVDMALRLVVISAPEQVATRAILVPSRIVLEMPGKVSGAVMVIMSGGEVNGCLLGRLLGKVLAAVALTHRHLPRCEQCAEHHRRRLGGG